ncbi:MAG TPA: SAM-dependent methyltransferase, partial [Bacteroidia bacterium]|nr:SAM-dependent methyltransferase [Bacteroidia bacterium]
MDVHREEGSFRDSSGYVVYLDQKIYRLIYSSYKAQYDELVSSGLYSSLAEKGWLIPHLDITDFAGTVPSSLHGNGELYKVIAPEQIPFISYPYEWSPLQLKKAALLTLDIQLEALSKGFTLKDASAYNVQFRGHTPVFIDTLSFEKYEEGSPWQGYKQFCQQFLAPLLLSAYGHPELCALQQLHLDGIPLKLVSRILPFRSRFSAFIAIHIHYHARLENNFSGAQKIKPKQLQLSKTRLIS